MALLRQRLSALVQEIRHVASPRLGNVLLTLSTYKARRELAGASPLEILVDSSVLALAVTHETRWVSTGRHPWGQQMPDTGNMARVPVRRKPNRHASPEAKRDYEEVCYLVGLVHLARIGLVRFKTSGELRVEQWKHPVGRFKGYGYFDLSLFNGIDIESVDRMAEMHFQPSWKKGPSWADQQKERLQNSTDALYKGIVKHLGSTNSQDAWHIRTAETYGLFCLLTVDRSLCTNFRQRSQQEPIRSLHTTVLTPTELGRRLGLRPLDPKYLSYEGASFPVRPDLSMPGDKRRRYKRHGP